MSFKVGVMASSKPAGFVGDISTGTYTEIAFYDLVDSFIVTSRSISPAIAFNYSGGYWFRNVSTLTMSATGPSGTTGVSILLNGEYSSNGTTWNTNPGTNALGVAVHRMTANLTVTTGGNFI